MHVKPAAGGGLVAVAAIVAGCAHVAGSKGPEEPTRRVQAEAASVPEIAYEEEYADAHHVYQALPATAAERIPLRGKLVRYLLQPVAQLDAEALRAEVRETGVDEIYDGVFASFRDALNLFDAAEIWNAHPAPPPERDLLIRSARLVVALFSPRGADAQVATALAVLVSLESAATEWTSALDQLLPWTDEAAAAAMESTGSKRPSTAIDVLESAASAWPSPAVAERLARRYVERQEKLVSILRKPMAKGDAATRKLGDLLLTHGDEIQRVTTNLAALYLRCGRLDDAARAVAAVAQQAGDDPELRQIIADAARPGAVAADLLVLARRFLPKIDALGGTAPEIADPVVAFRILRMAAARFPADADTLTLGARVAVRMGAPLLALRYAEEAKTALEARGAAPAALRAVHGEVLDLHFERVRLRLDPDRIEPAAREAALLRQRLAETRKAFPSGEEREWSLRDTNLDFELGRGYLHAGLIVEAEPLLARANASAEPTTEVTLELSGLALKKGDWARAVEILRARLDVLKTREGAGGRETLPTVEAQARLRRLLGDALDTAGQRAAAEEAWETSARGWERLLADALRRRNPRPLAEMDFEIGRLYYLLGRRDDGIQKLNEAIDHNEDRQQSYLDAIAFLVQNGEVEAAVAVHRRALSRPDRSVSEYIKVYSSLWIADVTRRSTNVPDSGAEAFLRTLDSRRHNLRPTRGGDWYRRLARYATGKVPYQEVLAAADTAGKRAEIYFYEAMRRLAEGKTSDAGLLWKQVLDTHMVSFFEFEMAARYLRLGAPSRPPAPRPTSAETI